MAVDPSKYVTPFSPFPIYNRMDLTQASQNQQQLDETALAKKRQVEQQAAQAKLEHELGLKKEEGENQRAANTVQFNKDKFAGERTDKEKEVIRQTVTSFQNDLASGNLRGAYAKVPLLKTMGVDLPNAGTADAPNFQLHMPDFLQDHPISAALGGGSPAVETSTNTSNGYNYDVPELNRLSQGQNDALFTGLNNSIIPRYQPAVGELLKGVGTLNLNTPESYKMSLDALEKITPLMRTEMTTDAMRDAAAINSGQKAASQSRLEEGQSWNQAKDVANANGLTDKLGKISIANQAIAALNDKNYAGDPATVKLVAGMFEQARLTDQDYKLMESGQRSLLQELQDKTSQAFQNGLSIDQREGLKRFLNTLIGANRDNLKRVQNQILSIDPADPTYLKYLRGNIPIELWSDEVKNSGKRGAPSNHTPAPSGVGTNDNLGKSVVPPTLSADEQADELLR